MCECMYLVPTVAVVHSGRTVRFRQRSAPVQFYFCVFLLSRQYQITVNNIEVLFYTTANTVLKVTRKYSELCVECGT